MPNKNPKSKFETAIASLEEFCKKLNDEFEPAGPPTQDDATHPSKQPVYFFQRQDLGSIALTGPDIDEFRYCLLNLYHVVPHGTDAISFRAVESVVHESILKAFSPNTQNPELPFAEKLTAAFLELREKLRRAPTPWWIHLPVAGLVTEELPRKVGSIEFYIRSYAASGLPQPEGPTQGVVTTACACVPVKAADSDAAVELAIRELRQTIDLLNYFGGVVGNRGARVCLPWEARAFNLPAGISVTEGYHPSSMRHQWRGPWIPFSLNLLFDTPNAKRGGFPRALEILTKTNRSKLDERLLSAIQWAGRATVEERREEAFVLFTVAMESLLVNKNDKDQVTQRFAIRGAHLLGNDFASRKILYRRLKELYDLRSAIVHSGSTEIADADRDTIAHLVRATIFTMLVLKPFCDMQRVEEFHTWFEDATLGRDKSTPASSVESEQKSSSD
jgi:hypothetical protein